MKCGIKFELLVQSLYEEMLLEDEQKIDIRHNQKVQGASGQKHQIDLLWHTTVAGVKQIVLVECKDYKSKVSISKIRDFYGVVQDVPGSIGVFVCSSSYQKGAITYAESKGIQLFSVESIIESQRCYTSILTDFKFYHVSTPVIEPLVDIEWFRKNYDQTVLSIFEHANSVRVIDSKHQLIATSEDIVKNIDRSKPDGNYEQYVEYKDAYIQISGGECPLIKIKGVTIKYSLYTTRHADEIRLLARYIVKNVISEAERYLGKIVQRT
ncbi:restriction endonuclease [Vibrio sp. Vb0667]|uniref:restriction endonuclease n=1 Tax=Vibrio TaxID=662 RepID=UPI00216105DF|nr:MULTISPECIES: restriction endonuclease [Vibrio]ELB2770358.1 restriction endonuclease [Vibrio alginolyticus]MCS0107387.1 restriction endonuclease [Vibrio alginolyticus]MDW3635776.1 restriction endonuclease [Vibrio sp. Vb0667]